MTTARIGLVLRSAALCGGILYASTLVQAQSIASRVAAVRDGKVRMTFASRDDICGSGNGVSTRSDGRTSWSGERSHDVEYDVECSEGPVHLVAEKNDGRITRLRAYVGGRWRSAASVTDLGAVGAKEATDWLLSVASTESSNVAGGAIFATTLADSVETGRRLYEFARNESHPRETRDQAIFWLGQTGGESTQFLSSLYPQLNSEALKDKVIFALSQRRDPAAIDKLMDIAKNDPERGARHKALFWLGQSKDPRVATMLSDMINR